jgi:Na+/melibiose symporter-like transporter
MYQTPAAALGVEITSNINERTQIQSIRAIFLIIAIIVPVIIMGVFESKYGLQDPHIYKDAAYINGAVCLVCGMIAVMGTYSYLPRLRVENAAAEPYEKFSLAKVFRSFFDALKDNNVKSIIGGYTASLMSIVFLSSLMIHVLQFTFMIDDIFVLLGAVFVMTILSQPLWIFVSKRFDKKVALFAGIITALVGTCGLFIVYLARLPLIESGAVFWALLPFLGVMGIGAGAMYSMPLSMLGDTIAYKFKGKGEQKTGSYTGYTTLANKLSQSITLMFIGVMLDIVGFDGEKEVQAPSVQWALGAMLIGGIAAALAAGLLFYRKYSLKKEDILKIVEPREETPQEDFI